MATYTVKVETPTVPNFVKIVLEKDGAHSHIPVGDLKDDELRSLAKDWTEKLLKTAEYQRKHRNNP